MTEKFNGDFCAFFRGIQTNPAAITPQITVGELLAARKHIKDCEECAAIVEQVSAAAPPEDRVNLN